MLLTFARWRHFAFKVDNVCVRVETTPMFAKNRANLFRRSEVQSKHWPGFSGHLVWTCISSIKHYSTDVFVLQCLVKATKGSRGIS